mmetsp:Transcript_9167/g.13574  ORF Transcript_9167/g.13574 Transcript_9167/m.13574 type:complete len:206 (-) Transcript_9167:2115-2732(-)
MSQLTTDERLISLLSLFSSKMKLATPSTKEIPSKCPRTDVAAAFFTSRISFPYDPFPFENDTKSPRRGVSRLSCNIFDDNEFSLYKTCVPIELLVSASAKSLPFLEQTASGSGSSFTSFSPPSITAAVVSTFSCAKSCTSNLGSTDSLSLLGVFFWVRRAGVAYNIAGSKVSRIIPSSFVFSTFSSFSFPTFCHRPPATSGAFGE